MIRFCDKEVYLVNKGEISRTELLTFFLKDEAARKSVIAVYDDGRLCGIITYEGLLKGNDINSTIMRATDSFWKSAKEYFIEQPSELITIVDENESILGFAYNDVQHNDYLIERGYLEILESGSVPVFSEDNYKKLKLLVLTDLNEFAWRIQKIFQREGYCVCVIGEKWEWFGYTSGEGYFDYPEFQKMYIYAEGTEMLRLEQSTSTVRFNDVSKAFDGIRTLILDSMKIIYKQEIRKLIEKGISVVEFAIPSETAIEYKTELEWKSMALQVGMGGWQNDIGFAREEKIQIVKSIYGEHMLDMFEKGICTNLEEKKSVCIGDLIGKTLEEKTDGKRIYLIGPCIVGGIGCMAENTLLAYIQELVKTEEYCVIGIAIPVVEYSAWKQKIEKIPIRKGDILVIVEEEKWFPKEKEGCDRISLKEVYDNPERKTMFALDPIHTNAEGNKHLAEQIYKSYLQKEINSLKDCERKFLQKGELLDADTIKQITQYIDKIKCVSEGTKGAIVMNCNPFTYGHQYLIEYAAQKVDILYVFVVEENCSYFDFEERIQLVRLGTKHIKNVVVAPSGKWMISYKTFKTYFLKETMQEVSIDASLDLEIFARYIAPSLGIQIRFVGEEPFDQVTQQYNCQMKETLQLFDIAVEEIPRIKIGGVAVSATNVRKALKEKKWMEIEKLVPQTTYNYLKTIE